ncbi:hypothetical protein RRF57_004908 [Xylaria bambusicola]|uniref:N-acetyltransferase domain-containing protein n=1 Tax=Xylaria bambusicola TaxID=326684 RepID=A0AAN7UL10_9PEZI
MAVDPRHQGRKAAAALYELVLELGEKINLPVYFESSPSVVNLYKKVGFQLLSDTVVHKAEVLGTEKDIQVPLMVRMPSKAGISFEEWRSSGYPKFGTREVSYVGGQAEKAKQQIVTKVVGLREAKSAEISP